MRIFDKDIRSRCTISSKMLKTISVAISIFTASLPGEICGADGDPVNLVVVASPLEAGLTDPSGSQAATAGTPLMLSADAAVGWRFVKWQASPSGSVSFEDDAAESAFATPSADAEITALFEAGQTFTLSTAVYPEGAGTVQASASGLMNVSEHVKITALESSHDSIFYKWTCGDGAELLEPGSSSTELKFSEGSSVADVVVTAHFLTRNAKPGSSKLMSSYKGNISGLSPLRENKAFLKAILPADISGITIGDGSVFSMMVDAGDISIEHVFSEDAKLRIRGKTGSAFFRNLLPGTGKPCGGTKIKWNQDGFFLEYTVKPPSSHNLVNIYSDIYRQGAGKPFAVDSSQTTGIPAVILIEDDAWCFLWVADGGLDYYGKAKSTPSKKIGDDIVSWKLSGKGDFVGYSWLAPAPDGKASPSSRLRIKSLQSVAKNAARRMASGYSIQKKEIDTGKFAQFPIWQQPGFNNYGPVQTQAPFFFNGKIFALSRPSSTDANYKKSAFLSQGIVDDNGFMKFEKSYPIAVGDPKIALFGDSKRVTTCVFKGKVYLFYDIYISDTQFYIYSCQSSHPEAVWENKGFLPMVGTYSSHGGLKHTPLKAVPFNGKIYLIYGAPDGRFHIQSSPDGEKWTHVYTLDDAASWGAKYLGEMNACVVTKNGQMMLCIAILGTDKNDRWMYLRFIDATNKLAGGWHYYLDWVSPHHGIGIASGTISGSSAGQAVQIFAQSSSWEWYTHVRSCTIDVESYNFEGWRNLPAKVGRPSVTYCDAVEAVFPTSKTDKTDLSMRKRIVMLSDIEWGQVGTVAFESDSYLPDGAPVTVNTSSGKYRDKSSWTLIGVIHGTPPFTRNGNKAKTSQCQIKYSRSSAQSSSHDHEFEGEVWLNLAGLFEATAEDQGIKAEVGATFKDTVTLGWGWSEKVESGREITFYSDGTNKDGSLGQLIYLAPTLISQPYCLYDQSGKLRLLSYNIVNVKGLNVQPEEFSLENPPPGMALRSRTSDWDYWLKNVHTISYDPYYFDVYSNNIVASQSNSDEAFLSRSWSGYFKAGNKATFTVYANGSVLLLLGLKGEIGAGLTYNFNYRQEDSWGEKMTYSISELPAPKADSDTKINKIDVQATWYSPKPQTNLMLIQRPEWVPDGFGNQTQIPWLMTWGVNSIE